METPDNIEGCPQFLEILADKVEKNHWDLLCSIVDLSFFYVIRMYKFPIPTVPWRHILCQLWRTKTVKGKFLTYKLHIVKHIRFLLLNVEVPPCSEMRFLCVCTCILLRFKNFSCIQVPWNGWNWFMTSKLHVEYLPQTRLCFKTLTKLADVTFISKWKYSVLIATWVLINL